MNSIIEQMLNQHESTTLSDKKNSIKEVVQEIMLCGLSRAGFFHSAAFYGGTALRIFYGQDAAIAFHAGNAVLVISGRSQAPSAVFSV